MASCHNKNQRKEPEMENLENIPMGKIVSFLSHFQCKENKNIYKLPLNVCISKHNDITETDILWTERLIKVHLKYNSLAYHVFYHDRTKEFWILKENSYMDKMMYSFDIDYFNRRKYILLLKSINDCISKNGVLVLTANNLPNQCSLTCHFYDHQENIDKAKQILLKNKIEVFKYTSVEKLTQDLLGRKHNQIGLICGVTEEDISSSLALICSFPENEELVKRGYNLSPRKIPKVFISYTWKNKKEVTKIVKMLREIGISIWIDEKDIAGGDNIYESMLRGIQECDIALLIISNDYKLSNPATTELKTVWGEIIAGKKKWKILKLDDVNPDEIFPFLNHYKYYTWNDRKLLIEDIDKTIQQLINT